MGRKKLTPAELVPDAPLNVQKLNEDRNTLAKLEAAFSDEERRTTLLIGKRLGRRDHGRMFTKLAAVTDVLDLQQIKESKQYKGFVHVDEDGKSERITTWADYCRLVEGKSVEAIDLEIQNLNQLGEELFDSMRQVGLGPGKMREIRKLPEASHVALLEAAREGDKDALLELTEQLIARHAKEKEELTRQTEDAKADVEAVRVVCGDVRAENSKLELELAKIKNQRQKQTPPERAKELRRAIADAGLRLEADLLGTLRTSCIDLVKDAEESGIDHTAFMGGIVRTLEVALRSVRDEFRLPTEADLGWIEETTVQEVLYGGQNGAKQ